MFPFFMVVNARRIRDVEKILLAVLSQKTWVIIWTIIFVKGCQDIFECFSKLRYVYKGKRENFLVKNQFLSSRKRGLHNNPFQLLRFAVSKKKFLTWLTFYAIYVSSSSPRGSKRKFLLKFKWKDFLNEGENTFLVSFKKRKNWKGKQKIISTKQLQASKLKARTSHKSRKVENSSIYSVNIRKKHEIADVSEENEVTAA